MQLEKIKAYIAEERHQTFPTFAAAINHLNQTTHSVSSLDTPLGKAFRVNSTPFLCTVHTDLVGENLGYHKSLLRKLSEQHDKRHRVYAGAGGFINLSYTATIQAKRAILFDINPLQRLFWNKLLEAIKQTPCRQEFLQKLPILLQTCQQDLLQDQAVLGNNIPSSLYRGFSDNNPVEQQASTKVQNWIAAGNENPATIWLQRDDLYEHIHKLAANGDIAAVTLDVFEQADWEILQGFLEDEGSLIDVLYISNILTFYTPDRSHDFTGRPIENWQDNPNMARRNVGLCLKQNAHVIECDNWRFGRPLLIPARAGYLSSRTASSVPEAVIGLN